MKFFADTADMESIKEVNELGILDGVTTNPSLMAKQGIKGEEAVFQHYKDICDEVDGDISAEVIATDYDQIVNEGRQLAKIDDKIVVKVPMIKNGVKAIKKLSSEGIRINCTLNFSAGQAIVASKAGASYVSPFMGRLDDITYDGIALIEQIANIYQLHGYSTEVLAASVRNPLHIVRCSEANADVVTCPPQTILDLLNHPLTDTGLEKFLNDYKKVQEEQVKA